MNRYPNLKKEPLIEIHGLNVAFENLNVIEDFSLDLFGEDRVALIGANGAGKTTLLKVILGLVKPTSGHLHIKSNLSIGYLPQVLTLGDRLFPITVKEVINQGIVASRSFPRWIRKSDQDNVNKSLQQFQIENLKHQLFGSLSLGQKQMVLFARMMVQKPTIVFLDEPTSSLDVNRRDSIYEILKNLKDLKVPYVIITHDLPSFSKHIKRVVYLERKLLFDGSYRAFCENKKFSPFIHTHGGDHHDH